MAITKEQIEDSVLNAILKDDTKQLRALLPLLDPTSEELYKLTLLAIKMKKLESVRALIPINASEKYAIEFVLAAIPTEQPKILRAALLNAREQEPTKIIKALLTNANEKLVSTFIVTANEEIVYEYRQDFFNWAIENNAPGAVKELFKRAPPLHIEVMNIKALTQKGNKDLRWLLARKGKTEWLHDALQQAACAKQKELVIELVSYFKQIGFTAKRVAGFQAEAQKGDVGRLLKMLRKPEQPASKLP